MAVPLTQYHKRLKIRLALIIGLSMAIAFLLLLSGHPKIIERFYSQGFYQLICRILHPVFNLFPFSVGDVGYLGAIAYLFYALTRCMQAVVKKLFKQALVRALGLLICAQATVLIFYIFWGMNYFRPAAGERLRLGDTSYTTARLKAVTALLIDSANATRARLRPAEMAQTNQAIFSSARSAVERLSESSVNFRTYHPNVKPSMLSFLLNYMGTSGYYNPFTGEAQVNYQMPVFDRPVVACHEMSHQMGYGAEDEADFVGFLAGLGSDDHLLRYSAYHLAVGEFMHALYFRDSLSSKALKPLISPAVRNDFKAERKYWLSFQGRAEVLSSIFYDRFLKANNQPQGLKTYNRMVLLVLAMYEKKASTAQLPQVPAESHRSRSPSQDRLKLNSLLRKS